MSVAAKQRYQQGRHTELKNEHLGSSVSSIGSPGLQVKYKTEHCNCYAEFGKCDYGDRCQFLHGNRGSAARGPIFAKDAKPCVDFLLYGFCPYGRRCNFSHAGLDGLVNDTTELSSMPCKHCSAVQYHSSLKNVRTGDNAEKGRQDPPEILHVTRVSAPSFRFSSGSEQPSPYGQSSLKSSRENSINASFGLDEHDTMESHNELSYDSIEMD